MEQPFIKRQCRIRSVKEKNAVQTLYELKNDLSISNIFNFISKMPLSHKDIDIIYSQQIKHLHKLIPHYQTDSIYKILFSNIEENIATKSIIFFISYDKNDIVSGHCMNADLHSTFKDICEELSETYNNKWSKFLLLIWIPNTYLVSFWLDINDLFVPIYIVKFFIVNLRLNNEMINFSLKKFNQYQNVKNTN